MASEAIEILIAADDKASAKLKTVGGNVEDLGRRVKDTGTKLKSSAELAKTFAGAFGGGAFGAFAGELGQISERIGAFSEVAKGGKAGALAFKAGLAAAVGIAAFKIGEVIGGWVWQTEKWTKAMQDAEAQAQKLNALQAASMQRQFTNVRQDIEQIADPAEREAATKARIKQLEDEKIGVEAQVRASVKSLEKANQLRDAWSLNATFRRGEMQASAKMAEAELAKDRERLEALNAEWQSLQELNGERAKERESIKAANEAKAKSQSFIDGLREEVAMLKASTEERLKMEAAKNTTPEQSGVAVELLKERDALKAKAEAEKEAQKQAEDARRAELVAAEKVQDLQKKELAKLQEKQILMEQGAQAARAFALEQQGLSQEAAANIAKEEFRLSEMEGQKKFEADKQPLQALESRLMTRGGGGDPSQQVAQNTAKMVSQSSEQVKALQEIVKQQARVIDALKGLPKIEIVQVH